MSNPEVTVKATNARASINSPTGRRDTTARRLRTTYIVGLVIFAALASTKAVVSSATLERSRYDGKIINIAGRQRMLSQTIAKSALYYEHATTRAEATLAHDELQEAVRLWSESHLALRFGSAEMGIPAASEPAFVEAYTNVQTPLDEIRDAAAALLLWEETHPLSQHRAPEVIIAIDRILASERVYLPAMNEIVGMHEAQARDRVGELVFIKTVLLALTYLLILIEAVVVFEPAVRTMSRRLREANAQRRRAEDLARHKADFLANMSHEIRTPMTAILGYTDLLLEPELTPAQRAEHIQTVRSNGEHLLEVINDILDMSKIEAGKLDVERVACAPVQLVEDSLSLMHHRARQKGLAIVSSCHGPLPESIAADPLRVRQILVNLISNAIKFTNTGTVSITSSIEHDGRQHWLDIAVADTGVGMNAEVLGRIFEAFGQAESATTRQFGGTGLGLSISKSLAEAMGGSIAVQSVEGQGSTFTLRLPAGDNPTLVASPQPVHTDDPNHGRPTALTQGTPLSGVRILLAEDGIDNQRLINFHLTRAGASVSILHDGKQALETIRDRTHEFDLVLMDVQMPVMDGLVATSGIRQLGITLPILALTANAMHQDRERCMTAGCDDFLTKPIDAAKLIHACQRWTKRKPRPEAA